MPFRTAVSPFTGDDDAADFLNDVIESFLTDAKGSGGLGWIAQNPDSGAGGGGSHPNFQRLYSRGSVGTEAAPFWFFQTTAKTLFIFSGDGVNTAQEPYDQPGNPMNQPVDASFGDPSGRFNNVRCLLLSTLVGPYSEYWLFGGPTGEYCHVVLKVGTRQYRHFHVGILSRLHTDLPADTFYLTNHNWGYLGPDNLQGTFNSTGNSNNREHQPYNRNHTLPFRNNDESNTGFGGDVRSCGMWLHVPGGYGTLAYEWWLMTGVEGVPDNGGNVGRARNSVGNQSNATAITKTVGDVNNANDAVSFGSGWVGGYDKALGTLPFAMEPTFTTDGVALMPIYTMLCSDFESAIRWAPVGFIPDVYRVNMSSLDAEEEITIGSDTYQVFPMINKDSANTQDNEGYSGFEGLAYRKITANAT